MKYARDADGLVMPPTPTSTGSRSYQEGRLPSYAGSTAQSDVNASTSGSGRLVGRSLVEDPFYRDMNLAANNIYMRPVYKDLPEDIASLVDHVGRDRDSPGLSSDQLKQDTDLYDLEIGIGEANVERYFHGQTYRPRCRM